MQEGALCVGRRQGSRAGVGAGCVLGTAQPSQEVCPGGMEQVIVVKLQVVEDRQRRLWPMDLRQRDGTVHGFTFGGRRRTVLELRK